MAYETELRFMQSAFHKYQLQLLLLDSGAPQLNLLDKQLRMQIGREGDYDLVFGSILPLLQHNVVCKLTDQFLCTYLFFLLPDAPATVLTIGPFLQVELSQQQIFELMEKNGVSPLHSRLMQDYYSVLPVLGNGNPVFDMLETFAELIWGGENAFTTVDLNQELSDGVSPILRTNAPPPPNEILQNMQLMEKRYAYENELIQAVSLGLSHKADALLTNFTEFSFERRLADPVRNIKNYLIIMNTLLRKAAESGGVHPLYLDSVSSSFARKIEQVTSVEGSQLLMLELSRSYCRLVKRHATLQYSLPVQKTIIYIDSDLSSDLSLKALAELLNINASYLSTLFKRETGQTLTDFVNQRRVKLALQLLSTTKLQIQTIAQHCGIPDINYFSKIFKKYTQKTPKEYRKSLQMHVMDQRLP